ncbi:hypothetical protein SCUP234_04721 [Seiridium cupressi]
MCIAPWAPFGEPNTTITTDYLTIGALPQPMLVCAPPPCPACPACLEEFIEPFFGCVEICNANDRLLQGLCLRSSGCDRSGHNDDDDDDDDDDDNDDDDDGPGRRRRLCRG